MRHFPLFWNEATRGRTEANEWHVVTESYRLPPWPDCRSSVLSVKHPSSSVPREVSYFFGRETSTSSCCPLTCEAAVLTITFGSR